MKFLLALLGLLALVMSVQADFSVFKVIRFPNGACEGSNNRNGTCYTKQECEDKDGDESGSCADGYGVCCTFKVDECGKKVYVNNTYIETPDSDEIEAGDTCTTTICPVSDNICRLRLDFNTFVLSQPNTANTVSDTEVVGAHSTQLTQTAVGQCQNDKFFVTCPGGPTPTVLCGTNSMQHMYVDSSPACNDVTFMIGRNTFNRMWEIKVSQIECTDMANLPPAGCTQWYREDTGTIQTFNFGGTNKHLANQDQKICFRRNKGKCAACLQAENNVDFDISGMAAALLRGAQCCTNPMATANDAKNGFDCLQIPRAKDQGGTAVEDYVCGKGAAGTMAFPTGTNSICSHSLPLQVRFLSDNAETTDEAATSTGFKLNYVLQNCA